MMDIGAALTDPAIFGRWFEGPSWDGWRAVLRAAFGEPMTKTEKGFLREVANREPPRRRVKELWCISGRRSGKDATASAIAAHTAATFDPAGRLRPGERAAVMLLAVDRAQSATALEYTRAYFELVPALKALVEHETSDGFALRNGVDIAVATNDYRSIRGRTVLCAILDEVAFWKSETSTTPDQETFRSLRPGMSTLGESMLIGITSAYRRAGLAYDRWAKHFGGNGDDVLVIHAPSRSLNPTLSQVEIDAALAEDPEAARADFLSEWRDDLATYVDRQLIEAAVDRGVSVRPHRAGTFYVSFCDPSGGSKDSFTAAVAHAEDGVAVLDCLVEVPAPFNPDSAVAQVAQALKSYRISRTVSDRYAAEWPVAAFARNGIKLEHSERDRSAIYVDALPLFTAGRGRLLDHKKLVSQFAGLERRTSPIGKDRIDHGRNGADDLCNSAAGAMVLALAGRPFIATEGMVAAVRRHGQMHRYAQNFGRVRVS
jgi:hypothetical protein